MWCNLTVSVCQMPAFDLFLLSHGSAHVQEQGNHVTLRLLAKSINLYQNGFYSVVQKGLGQDVALHIHRKPLFLFVCLFVGVCLFVCGGLFVCLFLGGCLLNIVYQVLFSWLCCLFLLSSDHAEPCSCVQDWPSAGGGMPTDWWRVQRAGWCQGDHDRAFLRG